MAQHRMWITVLALAAACGGAQTEPIVTLDDFVGTYHLAGTTGAGPLPAYLHESVIDPNYGVQHIVGGSFTIAATGGETREAVRVEIIENDIGGRPAGDNSDVGKWRDTVTTAGAITLDVADRQRFVFTSGNTATRGAISSRQLTLYTPGEAGYRLYAR